MILCATLPGPRLAHDPVGYQWILRSSDKINGLHGSLPRDGIATKAIEVSTCWALGSRRLYCHVTQNGSTFPFISIIVILALR